MSVRLKLPELLDDRGLTAYAVVQQSNGRIKESTLYRLMRGGGTVRYLDTNLLDALCDILDLSPGDLLERDVTRRRSVRGRKAT